MTDEHADFVLINAYNLHTVLVPNLDRHGLRRF